MSTVSALIAQLQAVQAQCGDIPVVFETREGASRVQDVSVIDFVEHQGLYQETHNANALGRTTCAFIF